MAAHLRQIAKTKRKAPDQLVQETLGDVPLACPPCMEWYWTAFCELSRQRHRNGWVGCPISFSDLLAWSTFARVSLVPFDVEVILALDHEWLDVNSK